MRKLMALVLSVVSCWMWSVPVQAAPAPAVRVFVDGAPVVFDVAPVVENGRTLVPVRALSEALGFTVTWDEAERLVSLTRDGVTIVLWIDSTKVLVDDKESHMEVPTRVVNGRTMVPLRFISETLGSHVAWDGTQFAASIMSDSSLREMLIKTLYTPFDQISEGGFLTTVQIQGADIPGGSMSINSELTFTSHIYNNEMYVRATTQLPIASAAVSEVAAFDGMIYTKASATSAWTLVGTYDPANISGALGYTSMKALDGLALQAELLRAARITAVETVEVDGVTALQVSVDLSRAGLEKVLQHLSTDGLMPGSDEGLWGSVERFLVTYVIDPHTGFVYQNDLDLVVNLEIADATGTGQMTVTLRGSVRAHPTNETIQFPSGLAK
jgi:hypothetical protein